MDRFFHAESTHFYGRADRDTLTEMYADFLGMMRAFDDVSLLLMRSFADASLLVM